LLRKMDDLPRLQAAYAEVFNALPRPTPRRYGRSIPTYRIGQRYADLLDEMKNAKEAASVRTKIETWVSP